MKSPNRAVAQQGDDLSVSKSALEALFSGLSEQGREQSSSFERMAPFRLQLECSSMCDADCSYCYSKRESLDEALTTKEIKNLLNQAEKAGIKQIDWIGGDPLERPDWIELMQHARYQNMVNNVWTCGTSLTSACHCKRLTELTKGGFISTHLDSLDAEILQTLRDSYNANSVKESLRGIRTLIRCGKPARDVCNTIMVTKAHSLEDLQQTMFSLYNEFGIRTCLMSLKPVHEDEKIAEFVPDEDLLRRAYQLRDLLFLGNKSLGCQDVPRQYCGSTIFVSLTGTVSPCYSLRTPVASIREHSLREILSTRSSPLLFGELRDSQAVEEENERGGSFWGCRANAYYFGSGPTGKDPICPEPQINEE